MAWSMANTKNLAARSTHKPIPAAQPIQIKHVSTLQRILNGCISQDAAKVHKKKKKRGNFKSKSKNKDNSKSKSRRKSQVLPPLRKWPIDETRLFELTPYEFCRFTDFKTIQAHVARADAAAPAALRSWGSQVGVWVCLQLPNSSLSERRQRKVQSALQCAGSRPTSLGGRFL